MCLFFFSSRRRHTRSTRDWSSDVCSSDLGDFGRQHLATWASIPSAHLAALCDVRPEALRELGDRYGVSRRYAGFSDLLADPGLDAIDIVTPAPLHEEQALAALASGRHVFCEKPLAETAAGAQR